MSVAAPADFPTTSELAAYRAWLQGLGSRAAVEQFLTGQRAQGASARAVVGRIRRRLVACARARHRDDLAELFEAVPNSRQARSALLAIDTLRAARTPPPQITDPVTHWLSARAARPLERAGVATLADLIVRVLSGPGWWKRVPGVGRTAAIQSKAFFAHHPELMRRAQASLVQGSSPVVPWEALRTPRELDGSRGAYRAPRESCVLAANNDYEAVQAWLTLQDASATRRAYRKEAERLMLWAIVERGKALSSLTMEDAIAYRAFLRRPTPSDRWVGPVTARTSARWRPFQGPLAARSAAYALQVIGALYRWLIEQRYVLANPFAGVKVRSAARAGPLDTRRCFSDHEWSLLRGWADGAEFEALRSPEAVARIQFVLDFSVATGLRASELVSATLEDIRPDHDGSLWLNVVGKGGREGSVALPGLARAALDRYLRSRGLPLTRHRWRPETPLLARIGEDPEGISAGRLWSVMKDYFSLVATALAETSPATAAKARAASPHWMRHTHASHGLARGVDLTAMRDNLRHSTIAVTSTYLHSERKAQVAQLSRAFES